jgi:hypothetical protein
MARYSWRVPRAPRYGDPGYGTGTSRGPYRIEVETHLGSFEINQDSAWHTAD